MMNIKSIKAYYSHKYFFCFSCQSKTKRIVDSDSEDEKKEKKKRRRIKKPEPDSSDEDGELCTQLTLI